MIGFICLCLISGLPGEGGVFQFLFGMIRFGYKEFYRLTDGLICDEHIMNYLSMLLEGKNISLDKDIIIYC